MNTFQSDPLIGTIVCRNYKILEKLDQGSFGVVYKSIRLNNDEKSPDLKDSMFAVKIEHRNEQKHHLDTLTKEAKILYELKAEKGFPRLYYYIKNSKMSTMV